MYTRRSAVLALFAILCPVTTLCDGFKKSFPSLSSLQHPNDELTHGYREIDNHQTMLARLEAGGALVDMKLPERMLKRPRELHPAMMTLSKRNTVVMQRQWKMEKESHTNAEFDPNGGDFDRYWDEGMQINMTADESVPTISFNAAEENTIELLVVVTRKMHLMLKGRLTEYLIATFGSVAQNFKHSSLKASVKISIVDIILLDSNFARREGLDDWSSKNHEEVMGKFCHWVNRIRRPTMNWDSAILLNVGRVEICVYPA